MVSSNEEISDVLTVETIVVTKLPQRLKMALNPIRNSAAVKQMAMMYEANIHLATFWYVFSPFCISSGKIFCAVVLDSSQTSTGLNQK